MDGFDHYTSYTADQTKWDPTSGASGVSAGRFGGNCINTTLILTSTQLFNQPTRVLGFAMNLQSRPGGSNQTGGYQWISFFDGFTEQVRFGIDNDLSLWVTRDPANTNVSLGHKAGAQFSLLNWVYVEIKLTVHPTAGAFDVHINGASIFSASNINTQASGNAYSNGLSINQATSASIDDLYLLNSLGSANNSFLGDCQILTSLPSSDGSNTGLTPKSGTTHYTQVNETDPDGDTTYNASSAVGATDTYHFATISPGAGAAIAGIQTVLDARKDSTGTRAIAGATKSGSSTTAGTNQPLNAGYLMYRQIQETDPNTSAAWTASGVNAAEFGARIA